MTSIQNDILSIRSDLIEIKAMVKKSKEPQKEILSAEETMSLLQINRSTFDRFRADGLIQVYRLRRKLYCKYSELIKAIENGGIEK